MKQEGSTVSHKNVPDTEPQCSPVDFAPVDFALFRVLQGESSHSDQEQLAAMAQSTLQRVMYFCSDCFVTATGKGGGMRGGAMIGGKSVILG